MGKTVDLVYLKYNDRILHYTDYFNRFHLHYILSLYRILPNYLNASHTIVYFLLFYFQVSNDVRPCVEITIKKQRLKTLEKRSNSKLNQTYDLIGVRNWTVLPVNEKARGIVLKCIQQQKTIETCTFSNQDKPEEEGGGWQFIKIPLIWQS